MLEKVILVIFDGLGDRPVRELKNLTPLEAAHTPNMDKFSKASECGVMYTLGRGVVPGSDTAHLQILGYDPGTYYNGRGPFEAAGVGLTLQPGDVAFRANWGTVDDNLKVIDRRAGRIDRTAPLVEALDGIEIDGVKFVVKASTGHRAVLVMKGKGLSSSIPDIDPHKEGRAVDLSSPIDHLDEEAVFTLTVLRKFLKEAHGILKNHELNKARELKKEPPANFLLVRGAGKYFKIESFREKFGMKACCIAGGGLYKGVASHIGMDLIDVKGATGKKDTNIRGKFEKAVELRREYDFIFVHVKAADNFGHDGDYSGKKEFIERIDEAFKEFDKLGEETLLVVTADHSTPCGLKEHSADSVPIMFHGTGVRTDNVNAFNERACTNGGLGTLSGKYLMNHAWNLLGLLKKYGS